MREPDLPPDYPSWLLPVLLAGLALVGVLGMTGVLKSEREADCEDAGGRYVKGYAPASGCIFPDEDEPL